MWGYRLDVFAALPPADVAEVRRCKLKHVGTRVESAWFQRLKVKHDE
jgi:hypothetical protein